MTTLEVFRKNDHSRIPVRGTERSVAFDVHACLVTESGRPSKKMIPRYNTAMIPTGLVVKPPPGYYVQVCSRSGLASRSIFVANAPGVIDPDYTGELMILLYNGGYETYYVEHGHRIAQLILTPIIEFRIDESPTEPTGGGRGTAGFGSTGA